MGHANTPPQLPEVTDEAGNTPSWVPQLGVALFIVAVVYIAWGHGHAGGAPDEPATAAEAAPADSAPAAKATE